MILYQSTSAWHARHVFCPNVSGRLTFPLVHETVFDAEFRTRTLSVLRATCVSDKNSGAGPVPEHLQVSTVAYRKKNLINLQLVARRPDVPSLVFPRFLRKFEHEGKDAEGDHDVYNVNSLSAQPIVL